jgi:hypothetical protein
MVDPQHIDKNKGSMPKTSTHSNTLIIKNKGRMPKTVGSVRENIAHAAKAYVSKFVCVLLSFQYIKYLAPFDYT